MIDIDYNYIAAILPDTLRRKEIRIDWLKLLNRSVRTTYTNFKSEYERFRYLASHNYQVLSIEHLINTSFSLTTPAYIIDGEFAEQLYIGARGEEFLTPVYSYSRSEGIQENYAYARSELNSTSDFVIIIDPSDVGFTDSIIELIKGFAQGGKSFEVRTA